MLANYFKIAWRSLWKNTGITAINIFGLSVGLACFGLFSLYFLNEFSYDRFHAKADRLYSVCLSVGEINGQEANTANYMPMPLGPALLADLPDVVSTTRLQEVGEVFMRTHRGVLKENVNYADPAIFQMFDFPFLYGEASSALAGTGSVTLTRKMAEKLFGEANPTGKILEIKLEDVFEPFTVAAVVKDLPSNSSIDFGVLLPMEKFAATERGRQGATRWHRSSMQTFAELRDGSGLPADTARLAQFYLKYYPDDEKDLRSKGFWSGAEHPFNFVLKPIRTIHHDPGIGTNPRLAWILLAIGGIILLIACINFTTLAIGRSAGRAREIGVRKVIGATRFQLGRQFLTEAVLLSAFSTVCGALLMNFILLPMFNQLTDKHLAFDTQQFPELNWMLPGLALLSGLMAGSYPALVLSRFSPLETLKSKVKIGGENWLTRSLVVFQFVLSVGLTACTIIMLQQLDFMRSKNPGFNKENVVVVNAEGANGSRQLLERFRHEVAGHSDIVGVSGSELLLGANAGWSTTGFDYQGKSKHLFEYFIDKDYMQVLGLELVAGRNFDPNIPADSLTSVIFNESAVRDFGWTNESAIGQVLTGYDERDPSKNPVVIGVVRDYHFLSMRDEVKPMMFTNYSSYDPLQFFVRIAPGNPDKAVGHIRDAWTKAEPVLPFRYVFLDDNLQRFYETEARLSQTIGWAGGIAILLACLGLLGLAALSTVNRTKEIGVRKVLGASVTSITTLLTRDFLKLVSIAIVIAAPLAWYFMRAWLSDFAYHIDIQWWMLALSGVLAVLVAALTVGFQSVKAALANPVKSLRNE